MVFIGEAVGPPPDVSSVPERRETQHASFLTRRRSLRGNIGNSLFARLKLRLFFSDEEPSSVCGAGGGRVCLTLAVGIMKRSVDYTPRWVFEVNWRAGEIHLQPLHSRHPSLLVIKRGRNLNQN